MEDFKNTPVIREEIYDKIFKKDKLNIVYSEPGRGAGFLCKSLITKLKNEIPNLKVVEAIDVQSVQKALRDLSDDIYAIKRLKEKEVNLSSPILYYIDVTDIRSVNIINSILDLYDRNIIQDLDCYIIFKSVHPFILYNLRSSENNNYSSLHFIDDVCCIQINNRGPYYKVYDNIKPSDKKCIDDSVEALSNKSIPMYINIEHCRNIISDACSYIKDIITIENLQKCNSYLIKVGNKLKENETSNI